MDVIRKINDELAIAGPVTLEQLQQIAEEGFQTVVSLRSKPNLPVGEQRYVEALGMCYLNLPIESQRITTESADKILQHIGTLPKPALIYCANAKLAAATVLMYIAVRQGATLQQAFQRAERLDLFSAIGSCVAKIS